MLTFYIATLFPEIFDGVLNSSMLYKAQFNNIVNYKIINIRDFGYGNRHQVDDTPYGGGDGMLLMVEPLFKTIEYVKGISGDRKLTVILPSPRGKVYKQSDAISLSNADSDFLILCPRYEGYDDRILNWIDQVYCIGNYVLTGGEIPAMILVDSITRLLPGVLGGEKSAEIESFQLDDTTKEYPQFTRPENFMGHKVPDVLLSGNHQKIEDWRKKQLLG